MRWRPDGESGASPDNRPTRGDRAGSHATLRVTASAVLRLHVGPPDRRIRGSSHNNSKSLTSVPAIPSRLITISIEPAR